MKTFLSKIKTSIYFGGLAVGLSLGLNSANAGEILIGIPAAQSGPVGVADHTDFTNGALMAIEEINATGGVNGHTLSTKIIDLNMLTPEGNVAGILNLVESGVHAIASAFTIIPQPAMDAAAPSGIPYLHGNTSSVNVELYQGNPEKYKNIHDNTIDYFIELTLPQPDQLKYAIVEFDLAMVLYQLFKDKYVCTNVTKNEWYEFKNHRWHKCDAGSALRIQFPVQDWAPVIRALQDTDAAAIMIDHWIAAELAAFAQQYAYDPVPGALVYLQYGPSQPEFLDLAAGAGEGMVWGTVYGVYADEKGSEFRAKYRAKYPGTMGMVYTGGGYDAVYLLADAWEKTGDHTDFDAVGEALRGANFRGVNGTYKFRTETNSGTSYPNMTEDPEGGQAHLFFQVQDGEHRIIAPTPYVEVPFRLAPWM